MSEPAVQSENEMEKKEQALPSRSSFHKNKRVKKKQSLFIPQILFALFFTLVGSTLLIALVLLF